MNDDESLNKNREGFRLWYAENKESYNKLRRERYKNDTDQQQKARERSEQRRALGIQAVGDPVKKTLKGIEVLCYPASYVAKELNRNPQTIRNWESRGMIPKPTVPGAHRYYTQQQLKLLLKLGEILRIEPYEARQEPYKKLQKLIKKDWAKYGC